MNTLYYGDNLSIDTLKNAQKMVAGSDDQQGPFQ